MDECKPLPEVRQRLVGGLVVQVVEHGAHKQVHGEPDGQGLAIVLATS